MSLSASETKSAYFGIGRRKTSVAKVILIPGTGAMVVNHKQGEKYLQFNSCLLYTSDAADDLLEFKNFGQKSADEVCDNLKTRFDLDLRK